MYRGMTKKGYILSLGEKHLELAFSLFWPEIQPFTSRKCFPFNSLHSSCKRARLIDVEITPTFLVPVERIPHPYIFHFTPLHTTHLHTVQGLISHPSLILIARTTVVILLAAGIAGGILARPFATPINYFGMTYIAT